MTSTRDASVLDTPMLGDVTSDPADTPNPPGSEPEHKKRSYQAGPWDISELLPDTSEASIAHQLSLIETDVTNFVNQRDALVADMDPGEFPRPDARVRTTASPAWTSWAPTPVCGSRRTPNPRRRSGIATACSRCSPTCRTAFLFFELWWKSLDDADAERLLPTDDVDLRHHLEELRRFKPFTLDERSEQIINTKNANGIRRGLDPLLHAHQSAGV